MQTEEDDAGLSGEIAAELKLLRENYGDAYTIGHDPVAGVYWAYRRDRLGDTMTHPDAAGLRRMMWADSYEKPVPHEYRVTRAEAAGDGGDLA